MNSEQPPSPKYRRTWVALLVGVVALLLLFFASVLAEPFLIGFADGAPFAEPRSSAGGWGNSNLWLAATGTCCVALLAVGYVVKRLSPESSKFAAITLLVFVVLYLFFAQFPANKSVIRIALWSIGLPCSLVAGAWLASRSRNAA